MTSETFNYTHDCSGTHFTTDIWLVPTTLILPLVYRFTLTKLRHSSVWLFIFLNNGCGCQCRLTCTCHPHIKLKLKIHHLPTAKNVQKYQKIFLTFFCVTGKHYIVIFVQEEQLRYTGFPVREPPRLLFSGHTLRQSLVPLSTKPPKSSSHPSKGTET